MRIFASFLESGENFFLIILHINAQIFKIISVQTLLKAIRRDKIQETWFYQKEERHFEVNRQQKIPYEEQEKQGLLLLSTKGIKNKEKEASKKTNGAR